MRPLDTGLAALPLQARAQEALPAAPRFVNKGVWIPGRRAGPPLSPVPSQRSEECQAFPRRTETLSLARGSL